MIKDTPISALQDTVGFSHYPELLQLRQNIELLNNEVTSLVPEFKLSKLEEKIFMDQIAALQFQETGHLGLGTKKMAEALGRGKIGETISQTLYPAVNAMSVSTSPVSPTHWMGVGISRGIELAGMTKQPQTVGSFELNVNRIAMLCKDKNSKVKLEKLKSYYPELSDISLEYPENLSYQQKIRLMLHPQFGYAVMKLSRLSDYALYKKRLTQLGVQNSEKILSPDMITTLSLAHNGGYDYMMRVILQSNIMELARTNGIEVDFNACMKQTLRQTVQFSFDRSLSPRFFKDPAIMPLSMPGIPYMPHIVKAPVSFDLSKKISLNGRYTQQLWFYNVVYILNQHLQAKGLPTINLQTDKTGKITGVMDNGKLITSRDMQGLSGYFARYREKLNFGYKPYVDVGFVKANENWMNVDYLDMHKDLLIFPAQKNTLPQRPAPFLPGEAVSNMHIPANKTSHQANDGMSRGTSANRLTFRRFDTQKVTFDETGSIIGGNLSGLNWLKASYIPTEKRIQGALSAEQIERRSLLKVSSYADIAKQGQTIRIDSDSDLHKLNNPDPEKYIVGIANTKGVITKGAKVAGRIKNSSGQIVDVQVSLPMRTADGIYKIQTMPLLASKLGSYAVLVKLS